MTRVEGWEERLAVALAEARKRRWAWGEHDCCAFARRCVAALLNGPTPWDKHFSYSTEGEAAAVILAGGGIPALLDRHAARVAPKMARRGDLLTLPSEGGPAGLTLGVAESGRVWAAAVVGIECARIADGVMAWRID